MRSNTQRFCECNKIRIDLLTVLWIDCYFGCLIYMINIRIAFTWESAPAEIQSSNRLPTKFTLYVTDNLFLAKAITIIMTRSLPSGKKDPLPILHSLFSKVHSNHWIKLYDLVPDIIKYLICFNQFCMSLVVKWNSSLQICYIKYLYRSLL